VSKLRNEYRVVTNAIITHKGKILLGKKEEKEGHPISGEWHFPGGHIDEGEEPEEAIKREVKEETGLDVEVHQLVDVTSQSWNDDEVLQSTYHCESENTDAEASYDLSQVEWVRPENLMAEAGEFTEKNIEEREEIKDLIKRVEKAPY